MMMDAEHVEAAMPYYRLYQCTELGRILAFRDGHFADDAAALHDARALLRGAEWWIDHVDVWNERRRVARIGREKS